MKPATTESRDLAGRLIACEAVAASGPDFPLLVAAHVCEKLRRLLSTLTGVEGFRSILERALTLTKSEIPSMETLQVTPNGSLTGDLLESQEPSAESGMHAEILVAHLLGLLITFIGRPLTLRFVEDIWPTVFRDHDPSGNEELT